MTLRASPNLLLNEHGFDELDTALDIVLNDAKDKAIQPGDIGVAHSRGFLGAIIRFGTRSKWNHSFVIETVDDEEDPTKITVIQAEAHGVLRSALSDVAPGGGYAVLPCPRGVNRKLVVRQARDLLRTKYAFVSCVSVGFQLLMKRVHIPVRLAVMETGTIFCSAVSALCLHQGGYRKLWPDIYNVTPADIAAALGHQN
jgi:hypothetical protein